MRTKAGVQADGITKCMQAGANINAQVINKWRDFFREFTQYDFRRRLPQTSLVDDKKAERFFPLFRKSYDEFVQAGGNINVWDVANIGSNEVSNCRVLGWFLNRQGSHGQGAGFMRCLLESVKTFPGNNSKAINLPQLEELEKHLSSYRIVTEQPYTYQELDDSRVDIVAESETWLLFIEAKIHAKAAEGQLARYADILSARAGKRKQCMIFLTLDGSPGEDEGILLLSWKRLAACFEKYAAEACTKACTNSHEPLLLAITRQFCRHINSL